jgi:tetratricopeptide (TPR) repeat protein
MDTPFADTPHLDMLHTARRLWQSEDDAARGCRLVDLEDALCGFRREGDVAGDQIPSRYFHFVRTGDARGLAPVFEHNRLDIVSLALLTARAAALLEAGAVAAATPREALGLGRLYQRAGLLDEALACFRRAAGIGSPPFADAPRHAGDLATRAQAVRAYAVACRRLRRFAEAASAWRTLLAIDGCAPALVHEAMEALAIHHEHRLRDVIAARGFALGSLGLGISQARQRAVHYRLARLERKHTVLVSNPSLF